MSSYAPIVFGIIGAAVGFYFGGPAGAELGYEGGAAFGASLGWAAGSMLGTALFPPKGADGPRLTDLKGQTSSYGQPISILYGTIRTGGNIIWQTDLKEHAHESGGKGGGGGSTMFSYTCSFATMLCEGPIVGIKRIWFDSRLVWDNGKSVGDTPLPFVLYLGDETQLPDPTIEADKGVGNVPAYRGRAYIVFTDLELADVYNRIPIVTVEVQANNQNAEPFGLRYYSVWDVDTNRGVSGDHSTYSHPFILNGQHYNKYTKKVVSYLYRATEDYVHDPSRHNDGTYTYAEWSHNLDGSGLVAVPHTSTPWPGAAFLGPPQPSTYPQSYGFHILGGMNDFIAYAHASVVGIWPDGSNMTHTHYVDGWMVGGQPAFSSMIPSIAFAAYPDSVDPPDANMWVTGTIIVSRDGGWVYAACGSNSGVPGNPGACVRKYKIVNNEGPSNGPRRSHAAQFNIPYFGGIYTPAGGNGIDITEGDDGFIYAIATIDFQNDSVMYKLDPQTLGIVYRWQNNIGHAARDGTMSDATHAFDYIPGNRTFTVYKDYLIVQANTGSVTHLSPGVFLYKLNYVSGYIEYISALTMAHDTYALPTPTIYLGDGYIAIRDGILDLGGRDGGDITLGDIVADISKRVGLTVDDYDVTDLPDPVRGYAITQQSAARSDIEALMAPFFFGAVESDATVKFSHYGKSSLGSIGNDDLGARPPNSAPVTLLSTMRDQEENIPRAIYIKYLNIDTDYEDGAQIFRRQVTGSQLEVTLQAPIVFNDAEAKAIVDRLGTNAWIEREKHSFTTPRKFSHYEPIDVLTIQNREMRITNKTEQGNDVIKWDAIATLQAVLIQAPTAPTGEFVPPVIVDPQTSDLLLLDIPLPTDDSFANGYPAVMAGADRKNWRGATLYKSSDDGASYVSIAMAIVADTSGVTTTRLADFSGGNIFDEMSVVTVVLSAGSGALASVTADEVLNYANEALIGNEIIQFKVATLTSLLTYNLSGLLRGRRGTEWATSTHATGERFVVLPTKNNVAGSLAEVGLARKFKAVTLGNSLAKAAAVDFTNTGRALQPYSPVQLGGGTNAAGDVTLNWIPRTRTGGLWRNLVDVTLADAENYIVQIWNSSYTLCARIITVSASETTVYTSAMQVSDFGAQQAHVYFTVGQLGAVSIGSQARGVASGLGASDVVPLAPIAPYAFPTTIAPPPSVTRTPDRIFTQPADSVILNLVVGQTWSGRFTTNAGAFGAATGHVTISEYASGPRDHHVWISTDSGGLNHVPLSEATGTQATSMIGAPGGGCLLAGSTTYYWFTDFLYSNGQLSDVPGGDARSLLNFELWT